jgi:RNA polymerase sigma-70 factor (ECF subfamily)
VHPESSRQVDSHEFTAFMRAYQDMVFTTAVRLTGNAAQAEDIAQEAFLRAYERFDELRTSAAAGGWLKTVTTNLALNHLNRYHRRWRLFSEVFAGDVVEEELDRAAAAIDELFVQTDAEQRRILIERALERLPDHQKAPLVLYHFEEMSYHDIAVRLRVSLAKVKTDILRGRIALAAQLAQSGLEAPTAQSRARS